MFKYVCNDRHFNLQKRTQLLKFKIRVKGVNKKSLSFEINILLRVNIKIGKLRNK